MEFGSKASSLNGSFNSDPGYNSSNTSQIHQLENYNGETTPYTSDPLVLVYSIISSTTTGTSTLTIILVENLGGLSSLKLMSV